MTTTWSSTWKCPDCGIAQAITPGQNTKPLAAAHECDSTTLAIHQAGIAGWVDGYRFALEHHDEPMVAADRAEFGTGWAGMVGAGAVAVESDDAP
jgi:hypothetical protein